MESSPSAHSFAKLIRWSMVFGLQRPSSSLKSRRIRPSQKASMALSGEIFSAVLWRLIHREIYDLGFSPVLCTHRHNSLNDVGRREVPRKFTINACRNSSQERMLLGARLFSHALALSFKCSDSNWRALSLDPPPMVTAVMKSSSQIRGSCCLLNLTTLSLSLIPFGSGVERIRRLKHSDPYSPSRLPPNVSSSRSSSKRRTSRHARAESTLF
jgi:hypothetical protein